MSDRGWQVFDLGELQNAFGAKDVDYREFLRVPSMSCGLYRLAAGSTDMQGPHDDDEMYLVLSGRARLKLSGEDRAVGPGSLLYIQATEEHSFFDIEEDMTLLVVFASGGN